MVMRMMIQKRYDVNNTMIIEPRACPPPKGGQGFGVFPPEKDRLGRVSDGW